MATAEIKIPRLVSVPETETPRLGTIPQVAKCLAVSRAHVYALMDRGELPYTKLGKSRRIPWDAVAVLVRQNTVGAVS